MHQEKKAKELLMKIIDGYVTAIECQKWLENDRNSYVACQLEKDDLSQAVFVSYFLSFLRDKGRLLQNIYRNYNTRYPDLTATTDSDKEYFSNEYDKKKVPSFSTHYRNDCSKRFPSTKESSSRVLKSKRRIKPTQISNKEDTENIPFPNRSRYQVSQGEEEMFSRRFSSKEEKSKDKGEDNACHSSRPSSLEETTYIPFERSYMIGKIANLYVFIIINNTLVPSITSELRFILNLLDTIDGMNSMQITSIAEKGQIDILSSIKEWNYFCLKVVTSLEPLILKLQYIARKFIYTKLLKFSSKIEDVEVEKFASRLLENPDVPYDVVKGETTFNVTSSNEHSCFYEERSRFLEEQKNWDQYISDDEMLTKLDFIQNFDGSFSALYYFGQLFVECLINSIQERAHCKADNDKKLAQLSSRLKKPLPAEPDNEVLFNDHELFFKNVIDYCLLHHPKHVHFIKHWLCFNIQDLSVYTQEAIGGSLPCDVKNSILFDLKLKISLAKFLGYIEFFHNKSNWELSNKERDIFSKVYSEVLPHLDIKHLLIKAIEMGTLTVTIPWIVQYLCMADYFTPYIPYYYDTIYILLSFYLCNPQKVFKNESENIYRSSDPKKEYLIKLSLMLPSRHSNKLDDTTYTERKTFYIKETPCMFLKLWIGKLFGHKIFGESIFYEIFNKYITNWNFFKKGGASAWNCIDCGDLIDNDTFYILCPHFSRLKYWENSNSFPRNIRPLLLEPENEEKPSNIAAELEEQFLSDYQNVNTLLNFIISRMSNLFEYKLSQLMEENDTSLSNILKERIADLALDCNERATTSMKALIQPDIPESVVNASYLICSRKLNEVLNNFLVSKGLESFVLKSISITETVSQPEEKSREPATFDSDTENSSGNHNDKSNQGPLSRMFSRVNALTQQLTCDEGSTEENVSAALKNFSEICDLLGESCDKQLCEDMYCISWNYTLHLVIVKPKLATETFLDEISRLWGKFHFGNNETRILCPRVISPSAVQEKAKQKIISKKITLLINLALKQQLLTSELLTAQCISLLQYTWTKEELEFIEIIISSILDSTAGLPISDRLSIDAVAEQIDAIKSFEAA